MITQEQKQKIQDSILGLAGARGFSCREGQFLDEGYHTSLTVNTRRLFEYLDSIEEGKEAGGHLTKEEYMFITSLAELIEEINALYFLLPETLMIRSHENNRTVAQIATFLEASSRQILKDYLTSILEPVKIEPELSKQNPEDQ